ncbi:MAG: GDSL-type esterase/lipase family protein [Sedimenticola sp.]
MEPDTSKQSTLILQQDLSQDTVSSKQSTLILQQNGQHNTVDLSQSDSFSGFSSLSSFDIEQTICDKLHGVFFSMECSTNQTTIVFFLTTIFGSFMDQFTGAFQGQADISKDKFKLTTHVHKKNVYIEIDKANRQLKISGPGQDLWRANHFKKLSMNLYRTLIASDQTAIEPDPLQQLTSTPAAGSHMQRLFSAPPSPVQEMPSGGDVELPVAQQISIVTDMLANLSTQIATLQTQVTNLTTEIVKLRERQTTTEHGQSSSITQSPNDPSIVFVPTPPAMNRENGTPQTNANSENNLRPRIEITANNEPNVQSTDPNQAENVTVRPDTDNENERPNNRGARTLIIGDSILSGINRKGLNNNVECLTVPGATVLTIHRKIKIYDLKQFKNVIVYVGGNDASKDIDSELFDNQYEQLIMYVKEANNLCNIFICSSCPRGDVNVEDINNILKRQCDTHNLKLIDTHGAYFDKNGQLRSYFYRPRDNIHLSNSGTKRLLGTINKEIHIVENFEQCVHESQKQRHSEWNHATRQPGQAEPTINRLNGHSDGQRDWRSEEPYSGNGQGDEPYRGDRRRGERYDRDRRYVEPHGGDRRYGEPYSGERRRDEPHNGERRRDEPHRGDRRRDEPYNGERRRDEPHGGDRRRDEPYNGERRCDEPHGGDRRRDEPHGGERRRDERYSGDRRQNELCSAPIPGRLVERCMKCGLDNHVTSECRHKKQLQCFKCKFMGHKDSYCWNI